jgi:pimeloyl-ACP methyl ester carboxylesterase
VLHALAAAAHDEQSWERLRSALAQTQGAPWAEFSRLPRTLIAWNTPGREADILGFIARQHRTDYDVLPTWAQLEMPVLYQVGELDRSVPGPDSAARIAAALAHNPHAVVRVYPRGDHPLFESESGYPRDIRNASRYAEGYLADLDAFVRRAAARRG